MENPHFFAAPTKDRLAAALKTNETRVVSVKQAAWGTVTCEPDDDTNDVQFVCAFNGVEKRVRAGDVEHRFLQGYLYKRHFPCVNSAG
ncbi:hypothetical protein FHR53_000625 [Xanthomonas arboricola]|uniref:hypothetical protein n=1 Tax=Xanthomonas cannabis TaxID=1885674 RepID=UPI0015C70AEC|nr:hypothetical protein [Xanthomonas cannabis]